jgi:hypothetical protein
MMRFNARTTLRLSFAAALLAAGYLGCSSDDTTTGGGGSAASTSTGTATGTTPQGGNGGSGANGTGGEAQGGAGAQGGSDIPTASCDPLPAPTGNVVTVGPSQSDELVGIVQAATTGTTIMLEPGTYLMSGGDEGSRRLQFLVPGVTMRSSTGNRDDVVIDGEYVTEEIVTVSASDVVIADLSIKRSVYHPIHVMGAPGTVTGVRLYNLHLIDAAEQFVKVNPSASWDYVDDGELGCSLLEMTDEGRPNVNTSGGGCYTGGFDGHGAWGWNIHDNTFVGIYCDGAGLAEHAVHCWNGCRDTLVERNVIIDCARGVGFGLVQEGTSRDYPDNPYPEVTGYIGHYDGIIRDNWIYAAIPWYDTGIELDQAHGALVVHNTIVQPAAAFSSIDYRFENTLVTIRNNIVRNITQRDGAQGTVDSNLETGDTALFVDAAGHDLHLAAGSNAAVDAAATLGAGEAGLDIDGETHDNGAPDLGADERWP